MSILTILPAIYTALVIVALWAAVIYEVCKEVYPDPRYPRVPLKTLETWALRRRQQRDAGVPRRR